MQACSLEKRVVFFSNGHGEDLMAARIIRALQEAKPTGIRITGWPMVGEGDAYRALGIPVFGPFNLLPSRGFALMDWRLMVKDLAAGWMRTHIAQARAAARLQGCFDLAVAVGDVVPMGAACLGKLPFLFVGCAKSAYYNFSYTFFEKALLRRYCLLSFPRDLATARQMREANIRHRYVGIPCMDGLEPSGLGFGLDKDAVVLGLLPGSRHASEENTLSLLAVTAEVARRWAHKGKIAGLVAATDSFDVGRLAFLLGNGLTQWQWHVEQPDSISIKQGVALGLDHVSGAKVLIVKGRFADVLYGSTVVVGLAGTANEQAVGLGKPLVTFPDKGVFGPWYVNMKMELFGESAVLTPARPKEAAKAVVALLEDPARCARMAAVGRERMGKPGASQAIAQEIIDALDRL